jgi:hypothetical protein
VQPYFKVGSVLLLTALVQVAMGEANRAGAQKKPATAHVPQSNAHATINHKDIEFDTADDLKVRRKFAPLQYDDKGKPRKATAAELSELKGPEPKQPGYSADVFDLKPGKIVQLTLWKQKDDSKPAADNKKADNKAADNKKADAKNADKESKSGWVPAGTLTGKVKSYQSSSKKLTVTIDTTTLSGRQHATQTGTKGKITMPDVQVTFVMILSQDVQAKDPPAKKNN